MSHMRGSRSLLDGTHDKPEAYTAEQAYASIFISLYVGVGVGRWRE